MLAPSCANQTDIGRSTTEIPRQNRGIVIAEVCFDRRFELFKALITNHYLHSDLCLRERCQCGPMLFITDARNQF